MANYRLHPITWKNVIDYNWLRLQITITPCLEGIWKVHIFCHLFVCFQTSVYTLGEFHKNRNNSTVFLKSSLRKTWFTFTESMDHRWQRICSVWRSPTSFSIIHVLPNMNYQQIKTICNTTVGTSGAGTFYSSRKYDLTPPLVLMGFTLFHLCFLCLWTLVCMFIFCPLRFRTSDCTFGILKLFFLTTKYCKKTVIYCTYIFIEKHK
jgi:hypothetical protein